MCPYVQNAAEAEALQAAVDKLRAAGEIVVLDLPGHESARAELGCDRELAWVKGKWRVRGMES